MLRRSDGHIPAASVSGNGIDAISVDDSLFNGFNSDKCPAKMNMKPL